MQWTAEPGVGFTAEGNTPWLPCGSNPSHHNVKDLVADPNSILSLYRSLLALRRAEPALHAGNYRAVAAPDGVFAFERWLDSDRFLVVLNFDSGETVVSLDEPGFVEVDTRPGRTGPANDSWALGPHEGAIIRLR
jgi:alpha-glucosidase